VIETRPGGPGAVRVRFARRPLLLAVSGVIVLAGLAGLGVSQLLADPASRGIPVEPRPPAPEIALTDHEGRPFRLSAHRGAPVLLYFGYTNCKDVCPITLATWAQVARILGPNAERVRFLLVSVAAAAVPLVAFLVVRRRALSLLALAAAAAVGVALLFGPVPFLERQGQLAATGSERPRTATIEAAGDDGRTISVPLGTQAGRPEIVWGYVRRAAGFDPGESHGTAPGRSSASQFRYILDRRPLGHGTGTMTLGTEYALPGALLAAHGYYSKLAWEVGWVGVVRARWVVAASRGGAAPSGWRARSACPPLALAGLGAAALIPVWATLTFVFDYPIVGILYYLLGGYALALGPRPSGRGPTFR
jgi:hypothetical protein